MKLTSSFFSFSFLFHLIVILHHNNDSPIVVTAINQVINQVTRTCTKCVKKLPSFDYNFCVNLLKPIKGSQTSNEEGLGIISVQLAITNATHTVSNIQNMLDTKKFEDRKNVEQCLKNCLALYLDAIYVLNDSVAAFKSKDYSGANILVSGAMASSDTCETGFQEQGCVSPLTKENYYMSQLCVIAQVISYLLSQPSS